MQVGHFFGLIATVLVASSAAAQTAPPHADHQSAPGPLLPGAPSGPKAGECCCEEMMRKMMMEMMQKHQMSGPSDRKPQQHSHQQ